MQRFYTHGTWKVKKGKEQEFIDAWSAFADWTKAQYPRAAGTLLQDLDDPTVFHSFGPWESREEIEEWRRQPGFAERVDQMKALLEDFGPRTMRVVSQKS